MPARRTALSAWLPVVLWSLFILGLGSDSFSARNTSRILLPLIDWLLPGLDPATRLEALALIRKSAHAVEYAVLALLAFRALRLVTARSAAVCAGAAILLVAGLSSADEGHQSFSSVRTGAVRDVRLDVGAGALALALVLGLERARGRPLWRQPELPA